MGTLKIWKYHCQVRKWAAKLSFFTVIVDLYQSLQKKKVLLVLLVSENKQTRFNDDVMEVGTCIKSIIIRRIAIIDGFVFTESPFFEVNLFLKG